MWRPEADELLVPAVCLNFGDCLTYAVAKLSGLPLLCVGGDFAQTDLMLVPLPA